MFIRNKPSLSSEIEGIFFRSLKFDPVVIWTCHKDRTKKKVSNKSQGILLNKNFSQK